MRFLVGAIAGVSLSACAGYVEPTAPDAPPVSETGGQCDAAPAQYHIGHDATQEMGAIIQRESGARTLRWGPPNSAWTMDFRPDRVNVRYDEDMKITDITCG